MKHVVPFLTDHNQVYE